MHVEQTRTLRLGLLLSLLALAYGFGMGGFFGAAEDSIKHHLRQSAHEVLPTVYGGDEVKAAAVSKKAWSYLKRSHLHAGAIGAGALAMILLLAGLPGMLLWRRLAATALGAGALTYSTFWTAAALSAPSLGGTGAAKEALKWWSVPAAGACLLGLLLTLICFVVASFGKGAARFAD